MIYSSNVINGGASNAEVDRLWRKENGLETKDSGRSRSRQSSMRRTSSSKAEMVQRQNSNIVQRQGSNMGRVESQRSRTMNKEYGPDPRWADYVAQDGYGSPSPRKQPSRSRSQNAGYHPMSPGGSNLGRTSSRR